MHKSLLKFSTYSKANAINLKYAQIKSADSDHCENELHYSKEINRNYSDDDLA